MSLNNLGLFGDSFNVLTSLFTGLAFAGVIISVILQTQELKEARIEFKGQRTALEKQQEEMKNQSFDNKFFQMLNFLNSITDDLVISKNNSFNNTNTTYHGKEVFLYLREELEKLIYNGDISNTKKFEVLFDDFNKKYDTTYKYYFLNLYQIIKYIDKEIPLNKDAKVYSNIIRAQLSKNQLVLLFYNAIGIKGFSSDSYKKLLEKYSFFEYLIYDDFNHIKQNQVIDLLLLQYDTKSFGNNRTLLAIIETLQQNNSEV